MDNFKIYYGEYNLLHWLKLILRGDIELPSYQRNFVWTEDKVIKLMDSLKFGLFVPLLLSERILTTDKNDIILLTVSKG